MSELEPAICDFEDWSISVRADFIWLSGMGPERTRIFDTVSPLSGRLSCELKNEYRPPISLVKEATRVNSLQIGGA
jgi:hypothetical protein